MPRQGVGHFSAAWQISSQGLAGQSDMTVLTRGKMDNDIWLLITSPQKHRRNKGYEYQLCARCHEQHHVRGMIYFFSSLSLFLKNTVRFPGGFMGQELPGKRSMTPHVFHGLFCFCQRKSMSFIVSAIDPELISRGPLLVFHTPEKLT